MEGIKQDDGILKNIGDANGNIESSQATTGSGLQGQGRVQGVPGMVDETTGLRQQKNSRAYDTRQEKRESKMISYKTEYWFDITSFWHE
jgi:hypothetical protein